MATKTTKTECRLKTAYTEQIVPQLIKEFGYKNINEVPKLVKIVVNSGLGDVKDNTRLLQRENSFKRLN